ncbi:MAG: methyltransferase domain-containing protein [Candidatus Omnitrophica bacterium]|nr:methyltransferase domain-containing protein [Candidatus Omnitrophota bacterium]
MLNLNRIKNLFFKYTRFNENNRYKWIADQASLISDGAKVLDAGAGACRYSSLFDHCDYKTQDFCQSTHIQYRKIDYVCDVSSIPVDNDAFDVVLCAEVLEHVSEPIKVVQEFSRILKKNGKLLITAPLGCGVHMQPHIFYGGFTPFWYEKFLSECGFGNIKVMPNGGFFEQYTQESVRFWNFIFPKSRSRIKKILWFPFEAISALYFCMILPIWGHFLRDLDEEKRFTVGYFVEAVKK